MMGIPVIRHRYGELTRLTRMLCTGLLHHTPTPIHQIRGLGLPPVLYAASKSTIAGRVYPTYGVSPASGWRH
jgi:hypothetical protein